MRNEGSALLYE
jgi:hypothetical protein